MYMLYALNNEPKNQHKEIHDLGEFSLIKLFIPVISEQMKENNLQYNMTSLLQT